MATMTAAAGGDSWRDVRRTRAILAATLAGLAAVALLAGVVTPVPGGGLCTGSCAAYPFDDPVLVRDFVPVSFYWMYPAIGMLLALVAFVASLSAVERRGSRLPANVALAFSLIGTSILVGDYAIQLGVVWPSLVHGEGDAVAVLSLFNPHGLFVALEDGGYWVLGLALLGIAATLPITTRTERTARGIFLLGATLAVAALPALAGALGPDLGFVYEIVVITVVYLTLAVGGACVAIGLARSRVEPVANASVSSAP